MVAWLILLSILSVVNTLFLVAISMAISRDLVAPAKAGRARQSGLQELQDEKQNSEWWGPHISYRDLALTGGPHYDGAKARKPNFDGITIRDAD